MKIKLRGLGQGEHAYTFDEPAAEYGLGRDEFPGTVASDVAVTVQGKNYLVKIHSSVDGTFPCDRCLEPFTVSLRADATVVVTEDETLDPEHDQDNLLFLPAGEDSIELNEEVRQRVLLLLPMKKLCRDDCQGLDAETGEKLTPGTKNRVRENPIDPRWEALRKLKENK